jgi:hypothetical protein
MDGCLWVVGCYYFVDRNVGLRSYAWGMDSSWQTRLDECLEEVDGCLHLLDPAMGLKSS